MANFQTRCRRMDRIVAHVDMDAFFASVEQRDHPEYLNKPVIVGADPKGGKGRGVVSTASYEARKWGVHSAQPISQAFRCCPNGIFFSPRFERYEEVSRSIMSVFLRFTPLVESASLDEAYLEMTGTERLFGPVEKTARRIKEMIWEKENLKASVGLGPNKLIAKIASDWKKPDGFVHWRIEDIGTVLKDLPVRRLIGIGPKMEEYLLRSGIRTVGQLAALGRDTLKARWGSFGLVLWDRVQGIDDSPVVPFQEAHSISNETTFDVDEDDENALRQTLLRLSEKVGYRLRRESLAGKTVILKVRFSDFFTQVRHRTLAEPIDLSEHIHREVRSLFGDFLKSKQPIRLLGVGVTQLCEKSSLAMDLFGGCDKRRRRITDAVDGLKNKYGESIIRRGES